MTLRADVCNSFVDLAIDFIVLFQTDVEYVANSANDLFLDVAIDAFTHCIPHAWWQDSGLEELEEAFETILATMITNLPLQGPDHNPLKRTYVKLFKSAASVVIRLAKSRVQQQQNIIKDNFMADLFSRVENDIRKELLIDKIEPVYIYASAAKLDELLNKAKKGRDNRSLDESIGHETKLFQPDNLDEGKLKKTFDVYVRVAQQYGNMPVERLINYIQMKKKRNKKVHQVEDAIKKYLKNHQGTQNLQLSNFIAQTCLCPTAVLTQTEKNDIKPVFSKFVEYQKLQSDKK